VATLKTKLPIITDVPVGGEGKGEGVIDSIDIVLVLYKIPS
jgi:hypothetical protein